MELDAMRIILSRLPKIDLGLTFFSVFRVSRGSSVISAIFYMSYEYEVKN